MIVNSTVAFEGVLRFFRNVGRGELKKTAVGCDDWAPFANMLHFPIVMVRQNVEKMISETFRIINDGNLANPKTNLIPPPELIIIS